MGKKGVVKVIRLFEFALNLANFVWPWKSVFKSNCLMRFFFFWKASNFKQVSFFFASNLEVTSRNEYVTSHSTKSLETQGRSVGWDKRWRTFSTNQLHDSFECLPLIGHKNESEASIYRTAFVKFLCEDVYLDSVRVILNWLAFLHVRFV